MSTQPIEPQNRPLLPLYCEKASPNVVLDGVDPALMVFVADIARVHIDLFDMPLYITSGRDGEHVPNSAHYKGKALDVRSEDLNLEQQVLFAAVLAYLCRERGVFIFDERANIQGPHWHLQVGMPGA